MSVSEIKTGYMRNAYFDAWLVLLPFSLSIISAIFLTNYPEYTYLALAAVFWTSSNTHAFMSYVKVIWNKPSRKKYIHFITWVPAIILASCILIWSSSGAATLISIYYYTQMFHYVRQSYGLSTIYKRSSDDKTSSWLHQATIYMFPIWALLLAMSNGFSFFGVHIYSFDIGKLPLDIIGAGTVIIIILWLLNQLLNFFKGVFSLWYFLYVMSHFLVFYIGIIYFEDKTQGWICMAFWHGIQYVLFIWNNFQYTSKESSEGEMKSLKIITKNIYLFSIFSFVTAGIFIFIIKSIVGGSMLWAVPLFFVITLMFNFNHYIIDAIIWRRPKKTVSVND